MAESRVKDESFIVVQGWMLNKLQLKGTELGQLPYIRTVSPH